jgi:hypothetical protein
LPEANSSPVDRKPTAKKISSQGRDDKHKILVRKTKQKRQLGRPRHSGKDSIKKDLKEIGCENVGWSHLAPVRVQQWVLLNTLLSLWDQ